MHKDVLMSFTELSSVLVVYQRKGKDNQKLANVFRRFRKIAKSEYQLRHFCPCIRVSVRPSVRHHGTTRLPLKGFSSTWIFEDFSKICQEIQVSLESDKNKGYFT
jgi:hypothetical protein